MFSVGDTVVITKEYSSKGQHLNNWVSDMDKFVGDVDEIRSIYNGKHYILRNHPFIWMEGDLQLWDRDDIFEIEDNDELAKFVLGGDLECIDSM